MSSTPSNSEKSDEQDLLVILNDTFLSIVPGYRAVNAAELARRDVAVRMVHFLALLGYFDQDADEFGADQQFPDARSYARTDADAAKMAQSDEGVSLREELEDGDYDSTERVLSWLERRLSGAPTIWEADASLVRAGAVSGHQPGGLSAGTTGQYAPLLVSPGQLPSAKVRTIALQPEREPVTWLDKALYRLGAPEWLARTVSALQSQNEDQKFQEKEISDDLRRFSTSTTSTTNEWFDEQAKLFKLPEGCTVLAVAMHRLNRARCAVATSDDTVGVYDMEIGAWEGIVLCHEFQHAIACVEWAPLSGSTLAVGVRHGVCVWRTELPTSPATPTGNNNASDSNQVTQRAESWMTFLPCESNGSPVTSLSWCPDGKYLATSSNLRRGAVRVWDVDARTVLRLVDLTPNPLRAVRWSPTGGHLAGAGMARRFAVWETRSFTSQVWSETNSACEAVCWSPDGSTLAVASAVPKPSCDTETGSASSSSPTSGTSRQEEVISVLHVLNFGHHEVPKASAVLTPMVVELTQVIRACSYGCVSSARVADMAWDDSSERMALCFEGVPGIGLFAVALRPMPEFSFLGVIWGAPGELPYALDFARNFEHGSMLAVAGHKQNEHCSTVRFTPMFFHRLDRERTY